MRWTTLLALACALGAALPAAARAADGIKATAVASRALPVDILQLSFTLTERIGPNDTAKTPDAGQLLVDALARQGLEVISRTIAINGSTPGYKSGGASIFGRDAPDKEPLQVTRAHTLRIRGFKRVEDVLAALARNGVRHAGSAQLLSSQAEAARAELSLEAARLAVAKARELAKALDVTAGTVIDVSVVEPGTPGAPPGLGTGALVAHNVTYPAAAQIGPGGQLQTVVAVAAAVTLERLPR